MRHKERHQRRQRRQKCLAPMETLTPNFTTNVANVAKSAWHQWRHQWRHRPRSSALVFYVLQKTDISTFIRVHICLLYYSYIIYSS